MPAYHIERSVRIDADESRVRAAIEDFREWPTWSPWLCMEPETKLSFVGTPGEEGHAYDWDGDLVGAGGMSIDSNKDGRLKMSLHFLRPFKSKADVMMVITKVSDSQTEVAWHMDGKMPFFLFFMIGMMKVMIGMDYERGLKMLKEYVETGAVKSQIEIVGLVDIPSTNYVGVEDRCTMAEIGDSMKRTLPEAHQFATSNQLEMAGPPGAIYHGVDLKAGTCHYTAFVQTKEKPTVSGAKAGSIDRGKAVKVVHTGSYQNLGNAWSTAMAYQRYKKLKLRKGQSGFELYVSDPHETPDQEIITEVYLPLRG